MAINDYVPKFDGISEFVPQMYQAINETARNTGQIRKATADTTAQGWAALQKAFTDFADQGLQGRGLDLKAKEIAGTEAYRTADLAQRKEAEFGAEGRAKGTRELEYNKMSEDAKQADLERKNRMGIARTQAESKEKPDKNLLNKLFVDTVSPSGLINDQGLVPYPKWKEYAAIVPEEKALGQFTATLDSNNITDPKLRAQYTQIFKDWYQTGKAPEQAGQGNAAPVPVPQRSSGPAPFVNPITTGQAGSADWGKGIDIYQRGRAMLTPEQIQREKEEAARNENLYR